MKWLLKTDKLLHVIAGLLMPQVFYLILVLMLNNILALIISFVLSVLIGGAKELLYDKYMKKGNCDIYDFIATCIGIAVECILLILLIFL